MRISDTEVKKILSGSDPLVQEIEEISLDGARNGRDKELIDQVVANVAAMPDRDEVVAELKARIEAGQYNPTGDEIADAMIRRAIADRVR
ncbi:MAG: flagellar biosynthesis anti-sigma factor FlgM [Fimbriimonadaceae bacterium]|nr:flagellar biosynthesis anti-sigma factor FlgM [Chthonomonadaceae bacterium]MCO5298202.1 flagellar biosynthesis anti-sigma factor FlgM [Fimbriimonadaceae bacterium]